MKRILTLVVLLGSTTTLFGTQILLNPANVIGYSGQYSALFPASAILNQQTGPINESAQDGSYWLNPDNGPAGAFIVIDLGAAYHLTSFDLFNTHNAGFNDRGTGNFTIEASNSITVAGGPAVGFDLSGTITTLVTGTLAATSNGSPLPVQSFTSSDSGTYRYLRFSPHSVASSASPCCGSNVYGLNELRAFEEPLTSATPEPASVAVLGLGLGGLALLRRRTLV